MRVKITGKMDRARMRDVAEAISDFLEEAGAKSWRGVYVYLTPENPETGRACSLADHETGEIIEGITLSVGKKALEEAA